MALEDVLVVKFGKQTDIKQWDVVTFENLKSFEERKMQRIRAKEYVSRIDQKFVVARRTIDNVLGGNSSYTNTFKVELEADRLFIPLVNSHRCR